MNKNPNIEIRDLRGQEWVWTHKAILYDEKVDGNAYKVYSGLAAHANNITQTAFPGLNTLARKLHTSRTTVISCIKKLEHTGYVNVERTEGEVNVYSLLAVGVPTDQIQIGETEQPQRPKDRAREFFDGVLALIQDEDVPWLKEFLRKFSEQYNVPKAVVWDQVKQFSAYWTEKNSTGTRENWELRKTFEVELRLMTWFRRQRIESNKRPQASKGRNIL